MAKDDVICLECGLEFASGKTLYSPDSEATIETELVGPIGKVKKRPRRATTLQGIRLTRGGGEKKFAALGFLLGFLSLLGFGFASSSVTGASGDAIATLGLIGSALFPAAGLFGSRTSFHARLERGIVLIETTKTILGFRFHSASIDITDYEVVRNYDHVRMFGLRSILRTVIAVCFTIPFIPLILILLPIAIIAFWILQPLFAYLEKTVLPGLLYETVSAISIAGRFCNPVIVCDNIRFKEEARIISRLVSVITRLPERGGRKKADAVY